VHCNKLSIALLQISSVNPMFNPTLIRRVRHWERTAQSVAYRSSRPDDAAVRARLRELACVVGGSVPAAAHPAQTRRHCHEPQKLRRLYREERLQVRRRGGRKRALGTSAPMALPQGLNQRWSLDFLFRWVR